MQINFSLLIFMLFSYVSCAQEKESNNTTKFSKFPKEIKPSLVKVIDFEPKLPIQLLLNDTSLFVHSYDPNSEYGIYEYSLQNYKFIKPYFKIGENRGELLSTRNIGFIDKFIYAHNNMDRKLILINLENINSYKEYESLPHLYSICLLDSNRLLVSGGDSTSYKIREYNLITNKFSNGIGNYNPKPKKYPFNAWRQANVGFLNHNHEKNLSIIDYFHIDKIEIINHKTNDFIYIHGPEGYDVEFDYYNRKNGSSLKVDNENTRYAHMGPSKITKQFIYVPYSGVGQSSPDISKNGFKYIHVFDWEGNPVARVSFPYIISGFAVDKNNKTIYVSDPVKNEILKFDLTL